MLAETFGDIWLTMDFPFPCEIHAFRPRPSIVPGAKKILVIMSEPKINMVDDGWVLENYRQFDLIITYDRALAHLPNVRILDFGGAHCNLRPSAKDFSVSFVLSTGANNEACDGYRIRRAVALTMGWPNIPGKLFMSTRRLAMEKEQLQGIIDRAGAHNYSAAALGDSKMPAFGSMFHIAIENTADDYYFSEKLIDCMRTYTVPIYWGTRRVLEMFDPEGIIFIDDPARIHEIVDALTVEDYWRRSRAMAHNFAASEKYLNIAGDIRGLIMRNVTWAV